MTDTLLVQLKDVPAYLSMSERTFHRWVRRELQEIRVGRGVWFSKIEIERWIANTERCYECPDLSTQGDKIWHDKKASEVFAYATGSGISTNNSLAGEFAKVLEQRTRQRQKQS